ncbi:cytochrome c oxidase accessory protein CcoG [Paludibacterium paludis]|uniref:Ferredoxin n=1 Tax=Paludibacterium paludis TaxID=1225769 RepID=A0A918P3N1_9NEIS|nr:cytochrome c oxidase accessory protein CcoG [Paludibacterium paludis]GGY19013.1 ferredoxin [Paludibacterium paludis]
MTTATPIPIKIYPRLTSGRFNTVRVLLVALTQLVFFGLPWLMWNHRQAVWLDLANHRFFVFGATFWPQDLVYLSALLMVCAFGLFLWTTLAGRLWCGYACPQTVYTQIMLWIERLVEGDRKARMKRDAGPATFERTARRTLKHTLMIAFSLWTGFTLTGYFTPIRELLHALPTFDFGPWEGFWILFYAAFTWILAGMLREKVCTHMCPYARFQGVMFDNDTLIVSYDSRRGEPRGARRKDDGATARGDCIDCGICVQVCPTGIDIRQGLQYECIGCAACIDACDQVMDKISAPRGLIRYTTESALQGHYPESEIKRRMMRPRVLVYSGILLTIFAGSIAGWAMHTNIKMDVMRDRSYLTRQTDDGLLENSYILRLTNTSETPRVYSLSAEGLPGLKLVGDQTTVKLGPTATETIAVRLQASPDEVPKGSHTVWVLVRAAGDAAPVLREKTRFFGD